MLNKEQRQKLISGVLLLIPEYNECKKKKVMLGKKYSNYLFNTYLTPQDLEYKDYWIVTDKIDVLDEYINIRSELYVFYEIWRELHYAYNIEFSKPHPYVVSYLTDLKEVDSDFWEYMKEDIQDYIKTTKILIKKINKFCEILEDNELTISSIKLNFPELYEKYKSI